MLRRGVARQNTMRLWRSALKKRRGRRPISLNRPALTSHRPDDARRARMLAGLLRGSATAGCKSPRFKEIPDYGNNSWISNLHSLTGVQEPRLA